GLSGRINHIGGIVSYWPVSTGNSFAPWYLSFPTKNPHYPFERRTAQLYSVSCGPIGSANRLKISQNTASSIAKMPTIHVSFKGRSKHARASLHLGKFHQRPDWHGHDIRRSPCRRHSFLAKGCAENLCDDGADYRCNPAVAIEHRSSGRAVIDNKAIIPVINFEQG